MALDAVAQARRKWGPATPRRGYGLIKARESSPLTDSGPYFAPKVGGKRMVACNIVPRPTDSGNWLSPSPANMYKMCLDFMTEGATGPTWLRWLKPQIDGWKSLGFNCIRWFWDATVLIGDATHHGSATWEGTATIGQFNTAMDTLVNYLASQEMWFYATAMEAAQIGNATVNIISTSIAAQTTVTTIAPHWFTPGQSITITGDNSTPSLNGVQTVLAAGAGGYTFTLNVNVTVAGTTGLVRPTTDPTPATVDILSYVNSYISRVVTYPNVHAVDVLMEFSRSSWGMANGNLKLLMNQAKVSRGAYKTPLTCSIWDTTNGTNMNTYIDMAVQAGSEYVDLHQYFLSSAPLMATFIRNRWGLPTMYGESGISYNGIRFQEGVAQETVHPYSSELRRQQYQDDVASYGNCPDIQQETVYGVAKEWPTDGQDWGVFSDAQHPMTYAFTTSRSDFVTPLQTISMEEVPVSRVRTLDLSGPDTPVWTTDGQTMGLGWAMFDAFGKWNKVTNRAHRAHSSTVAVGLIDLFDFSAVNQSIVVAFNAAQAVASGGIITWAVNVRIQPGATQYYTIGLTSKPGDGAFDGLLTVYSILPTATLVNSTIIHQPFDLTHSYDLSVAVSGVWPTNFTIIVTDLTLASVLGTVTFSDATPALQHRGSLGLADQTGEVYYTNIRLDSTDNVGPGVLRPVLGTPTTTTLPISWAAASGGRAPIYYVPQYAPLDSHGFPSADWTSLPSQTGLSVTITGLTTGTRYATRIMVLDSAPERYAA